jgi:methylglutaconyl-CoA hydratase
MAETIQTYNTLKLVFEGELAILTLNRPEKRNAISPEMILELAAALMAIESGPARVVIITGEGKAFCAGLDLEALRSLAQQTADQNLSEARRMAQIFHRLWTFPKPVIAAVNGAALAGGCGIATLCDFTVASADAKFGYTEVRVGFIPALVSMYLARQVGDKVARDLFLTGRVFDAAEAYELGLVSRLAPQGGAMQAAREIAAMLLENSSASMEATKRLLVRQEEGLIDWRTEAALDESVTIRSTPDFREGLAAFLEKRKPRWTGETKSQATSTTESNANSAQKD